MQLLSDEIKGYLANSSWIRRMFEAGMELKKKYGEDAVCDFSLGNPDLPPPPEVGGVVQAVASTIISANINAKIKPDFFIASPFVL